jgi:hypothetical protein
MKKTVMIDLSYTDWELLKDQKQVVLKTINKKTTSKKDREYLEGLLNWIDFVQDKAAEQIDEEKVFGKL